MAVPLRRDDPTGGAGPNDVTALDELPNYIEANGDCCSSRLRKSPSVPPVLRRHRAPMCAIRTCGCCPNLRPGRFPSGRNGAAPGVAPTPSSAYA